MAKKKTDKKNLNNVDLNIKAMLSFDKSGERILCLILEAQDSQSEEILSDILNGKIKGLEYCKDKRIKMAAGGGNTYCFVISEPQR
ncbi:MAG: hypothetical protein HYW77_02745 [Parcubacteria group bacterium]|nr:hypothetical protein [Parcubacteria group bacterium]